MSKQPSRLGTLLLIAAALVSIAGIVAAVGDDEPPSVALPVSEFDREAVVESLRSAAARSNELQIGSDSRICDAECYSALMELDGTTVSQAPIASLAIVQREPWWHSLWKFIPLLLVVVTASAYLVLRLGPEREAEASN